MLCFASFCDACEPRKTAEHIKNVFQCIIYKGAKNNLRLYLVGKNYRVGGFCCRFFQGYWDFVKGANTAQHKDTHHTSLSACFGKSLCVHNRYF